MKTHVYLALMFLAANLYPIREVYAQPFSFSEIRENLLMHRPQTGDQQIRENSFYSIDGMVLSSYAQYHDEVLGFYRFMHNKAMIEIRTEIVEEGATVWQIYNHGFIVKTASVLLGFDLYDFYGSAGLQNLADSLDVLFISHEHEDHLSPALIQAMEDLGKPVIHSYTLTGGNLCNTINVGDSINEVNLHITQHLGLHSITTQMFEVVTPEGIKIFHTGDNQTSETLPEIEDVDILLLNAWVNESGWTSHIEGSRNAIAKINPRVTLPGHILELGHLGGYIVPYTDVLTVDDIDLGSEVYVLAWGERYHFPNSSNDSIRPHPVADPTVTVTDDSIMVSWDPPPLAEDRESASFYRLIRNKPGGSVIRGRQYDFKWDTIGRYPLRIYSYDACGNQSLAPLEFEITVPDVNYPPRIEGHYPFSDDTVDMYSGVSRVFSAEATDPNSDVLDYSWEFDGNPVQDETSDIFIYDYSRIDTGMHQLAVTVSDRHLSVEITWMISHHNRTAIIDNSDTLMYSEDGSWNDYSDKDAYNGTVRFSYLENIGDRATYRYYPELEGKYDVHIYIPFIPQGLGTAEYHVLINDEPVDTVKLNQDASVGKWNELGRYFFPGDAEVQIVVLITGLTWTGVSVMTDAVRFTYAGEPSGIGTGKMGSFKGYASLECFPNPFSESTALSFENITGYSYILYLVNITGKVVRIQENITGSEYLLFREKLLKGFYMVELRGPVVYRGKIIIE